jgi:predicted RNase H-like HicB family nuclease
MTTYAVVLEQADDGGWSAYAPDVPGVVAAADTPKDAEARMREALRLYAEELAKRGETPPVPRSKVVVVTA